VKLQSYFLAIISLTACVISDEIRLYVMTFNSCFFAGYLSGLYFLDNSNLQAIFWQGGAVWQLFVFSAVVIPLAVMCLVWGWWQDHWKCHPVAKTLACFCNHNADWISVASDINIEFRR
jgi:hypothetical protein